MLFEMDKLETWDDKSGDLNVIVETPKGSRNKFDFDPKHGLFDLSKTLPLGMSFPYDFGFVPSTLGGDGDPLDVMVLMDEPAFTGCRVCCQLIGVIEGEQTKAGKTARNDRLIAVAKACKPDNPTRSLKQLPEHLLEEIANFFSAYHALDGQEYKVLGVYGPKRAEKLIAQGAKRFRKQESSNGKAAVKKK